MLFGHQSDNTTNQTPDDTMGGQAANPLAVDSATGSSVPATTDDNMTSSSPMLDNPLSDETTPAADTSAPQTDAASPSTPSSEGGSGDLLALKQQALGQLSPLVSHLDQSPEEKFKTTMMMLQSTDNQELLKDAFDAAQAISDDKARAQALLDVINEINYFTQKNHNAN